MSESSEDACPICTDPMDLADLSFKPCSCGYQVRGLLVGKGSDSSMSRYAASASNRLWTSTASALLVGSSTIRTSSSSHHLTNKSTFPPSPRPQLPSPRPRRIAQQIKSKRKKERSQRKPATASHTSSSSFASSTDSNPPLLRRNLGNVRVIQRNLVYITNLSVNIAKEEVRPVSSTSPFPSPLQKQILRQYEYFGQYGKIEKIVINKNNLYSINSPHGPSVSAYITFENKGDAHACIAAIDGFWIENRALRASFGTTKYCTQFLRSQTCNNPDCMYLHALGDESDSFSKEEIASGCAFPLVCVDSLTWVISRQNSVDPTTVIPDLTEE